MLWRYSHQSHAGSHSATSNYCGVYVDVYKRQVFNILLKLAMKSLKYFYEFINITSKFEENFYSQAHRSNTYLLIKNRYEVE